MDTPHKAKAHQSGNFPSLRTHVGFGKKKRHVQKAKRSRTQNNASESFFAYQGTLTFPPLLSILFLEAVGTLIDAPVLGLPEGDAASILRQSAPYLTFEHCSSYRAGLPFFRFILLYVKSYDTLSLALHNGRRLVTPPERG